MAESSRSVWYDASNVRHTGSSVCWSGVKVTAGSKKNPKPILKGAGGEGLSGYVEGGKFCAIMGPSGAGKTTLLNALAGRRLPNFEGTVLVDGKEPDRRSIAFVMQEDVLCPTQTPREALMFSAGLRLPATVSLAEKRKLVEATLRELKLERCADTLVGDAVKRGISGGEKKRTSIGIELVVRPKVLFLDEPTSGLDSYAAYSVVENLRQLSAAGCTVLSTIHQPSSEVFGLFADVIFLSLGETFYSGAAADLPSSLAAHGLAPPPLSNPADHTMFLLQTKPVEELQRVAAELNKKSAAAASAAAAVDAHFAAAGERRSLATSLGAWTGSAPRRGAGILTEVYYLARREKNSLLRDRAGLVATIAAPCCLNLLFAGIFYQAGDRGRPNYQVMTHFGAISQIAIGGMFGAAQPLLLSFPLEAALFKKEYGVGTYTATTYFAAKTAVEVPKSFLVAALTWLVSYWLIALEGSIILYILALWLMGFAIASTALLLGCLVPNVEVGLQVSPAVLVPQILFAGFFIKSEQIPPFLRWAQYLCSLRYGNNLFALIAFGPQETDSWDNSTRAEAELLLELNEIEPGDWWVNVLVLASIGVAFRLVAIAALSWRAARTA